MVEIDPNWNGVEVLVYLLKNDPALWFIFGFGFDTPIHYGLIPADLTIGIIHLRAFIRQKNYLDAKKR